MKLTPGTPEYRIFVRHLIAEFDSEDDCLEILRFGLPTLLSDQGFLWELLWELAAPYDDKCDAVATFLGQLGLHMEAI